MLRRLILVATLAFVTSNAASAQNFYSGHYNNYFHYSAPTHSYGAAPIVYHRVPIYVIRKKPTVRVVHHYITTPPPAPCGCAVSAPAAGQ